MSGHPAYYTTHKAAKLLGVSLPTVVNWIKKGLLNAYKTPGGHRRIAAGDLRLFLQEQGFPLPEELQSGEAGPRAQEGRGGVLVFSRERDLADLIVEWLGFRLDIQATVVRSMFETGVHVGRSLPSVIVLDATSTGVDGRSLIQNLESAGLKRVPSVVVIAGPGSSTSAHQGALETLNQPLDIERLIKAVQTACERTSARH